MEENGIYVHWTNSRKRDLKADGYIIPITVKEDIMDIKVCKATNYEIRTCTIVYLTSDFTQNPDKINEL